MVPDLDRRIGAQVVHPRRVHIGTCVGPDDDQLAALDETVDAEPRGLRRADEIDGG